MMSDDFIEYHKINSLFKRDEQNRFVIGDWATDELDFLKDAQWDWSEKIDGTNIRIKLVVTPDEGVTHAEFRGRTDNAQFGKPLYEMLDTLINGDVFQKRAVETFNGDATVLLFGEGYGAGIQKGGAYRPDPGFILFDVLIDNEWWMTVENMRNIGENLGLDVVPYVGRMTIGEAIELVRSPDFTSYWTDAKPEGLVGVPAAPLFDRRHRRIVTKVKVKDFDHVA
jgi:hypothetical protein